MPRNLGRIWRQFQAGYHPLVDHRVLFAMVCANAESVLYPNFFNESQDRGPLFVLKKPLTPWKAGHEND
jgi:hypothetical protein